MPGFFKRGVPGTSADRARQRIAERQQAAKEADAEKKFYGRMKSDARADTRDQEKRYGKGSPSAAAWLKGLINALKNTKFSVSERRAMLEKISPSERTKIKKVLDPRLAKELKLAFSKPLPRRAGKNYLKKLNAKTVREQDPSYQTQRRQEERNATFNRIDQGRVQEKVELERKLKTEKNPDRLAYLKRQYEDLKKLRPFVDAKGIPNPRHPFMSMAFTLEEQERKKQKKKKKLMLKKPTTAEDVATGQTTTLNGETQGDPGGGGDN